MDDEDVAKVRADAVAKAKIDAVAEVAADALVDAKDSGGLDLLCQ